MSAVAPIVLVVEDDLAIRRLLRATLERASHRVVEAVNARAALVSLDIDKPAVVLLDLGLPDRDGLELVQPIRRTGAAIIVVSARDATAEKVAALDLGADDFVTKPFDTEELLARVRASLRSRLQRDGGAEAVSFGDVDLDLLNRCVLRAGVEVHLTPKEYGLLAALAKHPGRVLTHAQLLRTVWGPAHEHDVEYLRVVVRALRHKLEPEDARGSLIRNEPGVGYRLLTR